MIDDPQPSGPGAVANRSTEADDPPSLSKEERKRLLARLEGSSGHGEGDEGELLRAQQALQAGNLDQASRLAKSLEGRGESSPAFGLFRDQLARAVAARKHRENVRSAEEMLGRYIQQRRKKLAEFALEALRELEPDHHRLSDYAVWIRDLDQEVALQARLDERLARGREALQRGDLDAARGEHEALVQIDPHAAAVEAFGEEIEAEAAGRATGDWIARLKQRIDELLTLDRIDEAAAAVEELRAFGVAKITLDQLSRRVADRRRLLDDNATYRNLASQLDALLAEGQWQRARELTQTARRRFPDDPRAADLYRKVNQAEAAARRQASQQQGIATLEQMLREGRRAEAELALKLLRSLEVDESRLEPYLAQLARLDA